ncbi:MAG: hypothetical protein JNL96_24830 [Planctomycetaceae bacterium]|nr:hypothetical protein [Planctomycetaceae bacterium]
MSPQNLQRLGCSPCNVATLLSALACATIVATTTGCQNFNLRGDGFRETFNDTAGYKRPKEPTSPISGFSTKARQIESDLGVR